VPIFFSKIPFKSLLFKNSCQKIEQFWNIYFDCDLIRPKLDSAKLGFGQTNWAKIGLDQTFCAKFRQIKPQKYFTFF